MFFTNILKNGLKYLKFNSVEVNMDFKSRVKNQTVLGKIRMFFVNIP